MARNKQKGPKHMQPTPPAPPVPPALAAPPPAVQGPPGLSFPLDFIWKTHDYTNNYIRFADTKAGLIVVIISGLLAGLLNAKAYLWMSPERFNPSGALFKETVLGGLALATFLALVVGFGL